MSDALAPEAIRARVAADNANRRNAEANDALNFQFGLDVVIVGEVVDDEGNLVHPGRAIHDPEKCLHALSASGPCSREYDPLPYPEAEPHDGSLYEGTGIAALYGLPGGERHAYNLAGWTLVPRSTR